MKYWEPDDSFVDSFKAVTHAALSTGRLRRCRSPVPASGAGRRRRPIGAPGRTTDLLYLCGGGIVSHPGGPAAGVRAVQQAWEAAVEGIPLEDYARTHPELQQSIDKFGSKKSR